MNYKIAIVYDWIDKWGGVERVLLTLHKMFPQATFFTSYYDEKKADWAKDIPISTSFIQKMPDFIKKSRKLSVPFYPFAFESFNFSKFDLVISVTSSFAKGIVTRPNTQHICYLLTPTRFLWQHKDYYTMHGTAFYTNYLQRWDYAAAQRPDRIISISKTVQVRAKDIYNRDSDVIYPPFDLEYWNKIKSKVQSRKSKVESLNSKFYLVVSRLEPYKNVELVLQLFKQSSRNNLIVVGSGSQFQKLQQYKSHNISFLNKVTDEELASLYQNAEVLIMPQEEDFGYVALEAQFFGCPVIAYKKGGTTETIIDGKTGIFFEEQTRASLEKAIGNYDKMKKILKKTTKDQGIKNVERFSKRIFETKFRSLTTNSDE